MIKGVILAGGMGTRLGDMTRATSKHLLPVHDSPMILHPIRKLTGVGITEIMITTSSEHMDGFARLIGSGKRYGCNVTYRVQDEPGGIAQALALAENWVGSSRVIAILGDNVFESPIPKPLIYEDTIYCRIPEKKVLNAAGFGVVMYKGSRRCIVEKPKVDPTVEYPIAVGIYSYPLNVFDVIRQMRPSARGEMEITDVNNWYARFGRLSFCPLEGYWTDAGTVENLQEAARLVKETPPRYSWG